MSERTETVVIKKPNEPAAILQVAAEGHAPDLDALVGGSLVWVGRSASKPRVDIYAGDPSAYGGKDTRPPNVTLDGQIVRGPVVVIAAPPPQATPIETVTRESLEREKRSRVGLTNESAEHWRACLDAAAAPTL